MLEKLTNPLVSLITESVKAPSDQVSNIFVSVAGVGIAFIFVFAVFSIIFGFIFTITKTNRAAGIGLLIGAGVVMCVLSNDNIIYGNNDESRAVKIQLQLSQAYIDAGMVDFAFEVNPHFLPQNDEELTLLENYKGDNIDVGEALIYTYEVGTNGVAKDPSKTDLYREKFVKNQEHKALHGDTEALIIISEKMSAIKFAAALQAMPKTCDNANELAEILKFNTDSFSKGSYKEKALFEWLRFTKKECIPIWNTLDL